MRPNEIGGARTLLKSEQDWFLTSQCSQLLSGNIPFHASMLNLSDYITAPARLVSSKSLTNCCMTSNAVGDKAQSFLVRHWTFYQERIDGLGGLYGKICKRLVSLLKLLKPTVNLYADGSNEQSIQALLKSGPIAALTSSVPMTSDHLSPCQ